MAAFDWSAVQIQVARNIIAIAMKYKDVPPLLHLAVCLQESGLDPDAAGDNGQSFGPHQIYTVAHPGITREVATSPWYDYAYPEMQERWAAAFAPLADAWATPAERPALLDRFAPAAQGSIAWPAGLAQTRYAQAVALLELCS